MRRLAILAVLFATFPARADDKARELASAAAWAEQLWKDALPVATRAAKQAQAALEKSQRRADEARAARAKAEADLAAAREKRDGAKQRIADLRARIEARRAEAVALRERLAVLEDADGSLKAAIDAAVQKRIPAEVEALAAAAEREAERALPAPSAIAAEAAAEALAQVTGDAEALKRTATGLGRALAERRLAAVAKDVKEALGRGSRKPKAALGPARRAAGRLASALPSAAELRTALAAAVRDRAVAAARALLAATWELRRAPAGAEPPKTLPALAEAAGQQRAADRRVARPGAAEIRRALKLETIQDKIQAAADAAHEALEARRAGWRSALKSLERLAQEKIE